MLPIRTTLEDIDAVCKYLATKPTGASKEEAKAVLNSKTLDPRKINALKFWGLIEDENGRMKLTQKGRQIAKDKGANCFKVLRDVVRKVKPYSSIVERAAHSGEFTVPATDVAAHWHNHFRSEVSSGDRVLNDQANCFFQIAQGADLGKIVIGRKGNPTRFDFDSEEVSKFAGTSGGSASDQNIIDEDESEEENFSDSNSENQNITEDLKIKTPKDSRVFITHGKNKKILEQVKQIVTFGKFEPVVAQENETNAKSITDKVMDDMRSCQAAVIHVGAEGKLLNQDGKADTQVNKNVLIEIGAALALYNRNFILLVEEGVELPSNIEGLYQCRYKGEELGMDATMKILEAFNKFK